MDKLEKAANDYSDSYYTDSEYPSEIRDIINDCKSAFKAGAKWQMNNMWIHVEEELPDVEKPCFVITKNNKCSVSNMYIPKDCYGNTLGEKEWKGSSYFKESIVAWMPIPKLVK